MLNNRDYFPTLASFSANQCFEIATKHYYFSQKSERKLSKYILPSVLSYRFCICVFLGLKLRRQHWFFLGCVLVVLLLLLVIWITNSSTSPSDVSKITNPEEQAALVSQVLKEVPLIDG